MNSPVDFTPAPSWRDLFGQLTFAQEPVCRSHCSHGPLYYHSYTGSGKSALASILDYLRVCGTLRDKMAEILVPGWLGIAVYQSMLEHAYPTQRRSPKTSVILAYHQFGFPQDMSKILDFANSNNAIVIEDCAHAYGSSWQGRSVGNIGDFAVFSYSKYTFCHLLGGVTFREEGFADFLKRRKAATSPLIKSALHYFKLIDEWNLSRKKQICSSLMTEFRKMTYAAYPACVAPIRRGIALWEAKRNFEIEWRKRNFLLFLKETEGLDLFKGVPTVDVVPYALPLRIDRDTKRDRLLRKFSEMGLRAGIRQFDMNRSVLDPRLEPRLLVPFHSQMGSDRVFRVIEVLKEAL